jgi:hypothetical protein
MRTSGLTEGVRVNDAPPRYLPLHVAPSDPPIAIPNAWAGGHLTLVPGVGVGRIIADAGPRVVEIELPAPAAVVFHIDRDDGQRSDVVVLLDPRVDDDERRRTLAAAELLHRERDALAGRRPTPPIPEQRCAIDTSAPTLFDRLAAFAATQRTRATVWVALLGSSQLALAACTIPS